MPHQIGFVDNSGGVLAHYKMLETIRDFACNRQQHIAKDHPLSPSDACGHDGRRTH